MALLDTLLSPFRPRRVSPTDTLGTPGTAVIGGYVQSHEATAELAQPLSRFKKYSELLANVSIVAAGTRYFLNLCAKSGWKVEPPEGVAGAEEYAERFEKQLYDMDLSWARVVRRTAMFRMHGFSIQEWTCKRAADGSLALKTVAPRPQMTIERWDVDDVGAVIGVLQRSPQTMREHYLPRPKIVYAVDDSISDQPDGLGLFRHLVEPCKRLSRFQLLEAFGFETDLRGIPIARAPLALLREAVKSGGMTKAEMEALVRPLQEFAEKHAKNPQMGMLLDSITYRGRDEAETPSAVRQWDMELLSGDVSASEVAVAAAIERITREVARILGVEGLLLGSENGTQALSRDKSTNFALIVDSTLGELAEVYRRDLARPIYLLNGWPEESIPHLKPDATQFRDIEQITGALLDMAQAGAVLAPDDPAIGQVRDLLGLSRPPEVSAELLDAAARTRAGLPPTDDPEPDPDPDEPDAIPDDDPDPDDDPPPPRRRRAAQE